MPEQTLFRSVHYEAFTDNAELMVEIPKVQDIHSVMVTITGDLTISVGAATSVPIESPAQLIKRVSFNANGKTVLHDLSGILASLGNYEREFVNMNTKPGTAIAVHPVKLVMFLDRINFDGPRPKDSSFQAYDTSLLQMRLSLGAIEDIIVKGGATLAFAGNVEVFVDSSEEIQDAAGKSGKGERKFVRIVTEQSEGFTAANSRLALDMPVGNNLRCVILHATDDDVPDDTLVNTVEFNIGDTDIRLQSSWDGLRLKNMGDKNLESIPTGFAVIDSNAKGKMSNTYDLTQDNKCQVKCDVNAPGGQGVISAQVVEYIFPE